MSNNPIYRSILLLFCLLSVISCKATENVIVRDSSDIPFHVASNKNTASAYWLFLERHPQSRHADTAKTRLAKFLNQERDKEKLKKYIQKFPSHKHLVEAVFKEIETTEKINNHFRTNLEDGCRVVVRPGEIIYGRGFFKAYVGHIEELLDMGEITEETTYEPRVERMMTPDFIKFKLLTDSSFIMAEKYHALVNLYYEIEISKNTPPGEYEVGAIIEAYQLVSPEEEHLKGAKKVGHTIEVVKHDFNSTSALELDYEAVKYFNQQQKKIQTELNNLKEPQIEAFGSHYLYKYNKINYTIRLEEYKTSQAEACYHLQQAANSQQPEIASQAKAYIDQLRLKELFVEYQPVE
jgi:hypothetical protein